jgi:hypothetical protein
MAVGVNIVSQFDAKGITKAIKDFKALQGAGNKATYGLRTLDKAATNMAVGLAKVAAAGAAVAGAIGYKLAAAAYESQKVMAQTEAIVKSTGGAAGVTAKQVAALSEQLSMQIGVDDELIQKSANLLLTFKQVQNQVGEGNQIFNRAVTAAQDLGNVFGSADAAAMQLGKALSDPEKGITALRRAGINFTESQKEQIKTLVASGNTLEAQKLILAEVESQVGGTAAASATAFDRMRVAVGNVAERFGALLIPYIERFANFVIDSVVPYMNRLADVIGEDGLGAGIKMLASDFLKFTGNMGALGNTILTVVAAFTALRLVAIAATISQTMFNTALLANPIGIVVASVIALGVAVAALYIKFEGVRKVVNSVFNFMIGMVQNFLNAWINFINLAIKGINLLIKAANFFGADIEEIGEIGELAFGRIGAAATNAKKKIGGVAEVAGAMAEKEGGVGQMIKKLDLAKQSMNELGGSTGGVTKAVETAKEKLQKYVDALKGLTSAQRGVRDANKATQKADQDLMAAKQKLAQAQENFNRVISGTGSDSDEARDAQTKLARAQRNLERSGYDVEAAVYAVKDAEKELADLRKDPTASAQAIREAEIKLAEAKLRVADANDAQAEATRDLQEAQQSLDETVNGAKEGSDRYKEALDRLNDAKAAQVDASERVMDALEREKDAVDRLREAEEKLAEVRKTTPAAIITQAETQLSGGTTSGNAGSGLVIRTGGGQAIPASLFGGGSAIRDRMLDLIPFAKGGIVTAPTVGLVGEAGSEAIIPLDRLGSGMTVNVTINAGMGVDPAVVGDEIVNVLQRYNRRNGALPLKVA